MTQSDSHSSADAASQGATSKRPSNTLHKPVFLETVLDVFSNHEGPVRTVFDGTFGRGGHTRAMLEKFPDCRVIATDWDAEAIAYGQLNFADEIAAGRLSLFHASYTEFSKVRETERANGFPQEFDLMLLDLGVSSPQLDNAARGFSFYHDGPLDMRMDQRQAVTAEAILNEWDEQDLARLFIEYGEVQSPFRVTRAVVSDRKLKKFTTTREFASLIERVDGWHKKGQHPATKYFMAIRLKVNEELSVVTEAIPQLTAGLADRGILSIITFHSLEDRIVKHLFKDQLHLGRLINKKVIKPTELEVQQNPRSRSAKLRAFEKGQFA